uniref:Uncharacterized protein n=1 Tax=Arundo donax TaxID=35708 RepID=A0A0A9FBB8_ARUDO
MEGDKVFATIDSLWFYSSLFHQLSSQHKQSQCPEEPQPSRQQQESAETHKTTGSISAQPPRCVKEATVAAKSITAARSSRELDERMNACLKKQRRRTRVVAVPARCSPAPMPAPDDGMAMKAHLRSWAHAVACSVR